jgi:hypothetical protein
MFRGYHAVASSTPLSPHAQACADRQMTTDRPQPPAWRALHGEEVEKLFFETEELGTSGMCSAGRKASEKLEVASKAASHAALLALNGRQLVLGGHSLPNFDASLVAELRRSHEGQFTWTVLGMCAIATCATLEHLVTRRAPIDLPRLRSSDRFQGLSVADAAAFDEVAHRLSPSLRGDGIEKWQGKVEAAFGVKLTEGHAISLHSMIYHRNEYAHQGLAVPPPAVPNVMLIAWSQAAIALGRMIARANPTAAGIAWR